MRRFLLTESDRQGSPRPNLWNGISLFQLLTRPQSPSPAGTPGAYALIGHPREADRSLTLQSGTERILRRIQRGWQAASVLALALLVVPTATVQASAPAGAGVATAVTGQVTVSHAASPGSLPLHFKDEVFLRDRISTASQSLARLLLGKKALLTVRELSELELIDQSGISTIQLVLGKVAIGVARQRMRPGEIVEIRTQNAVAAIRGTVVVAETLTPPGASTPVTRLHVLSGYIDVTTPGNPGAPPLRMVAPSSVTVTGNTMDTPVPLDAAARATLLSDLRPAQPQHVDALAALAPGEQSRAAALGHAITGEGAGGSETFDLHEVSLNPADAENSGQAPITPSSSSVGGGNPVQGGGRTIGGSSGLPFTYSGQTVNVPGDFYQVQPASTRSLSTDLLRTTNNTLAIGGDILQVTGSLSSITALPFMSQDGGTLAAQTATRLRNGTLSLTGSLLDAVNGAVTFTGPALLEAQGISSLTGTGSSPFVSFTGGSLTLGAGTSGFSFDSGSTASLAGPLFSASGTPVAGSSDFVSVKAATLTDTTASALVGLSGGLLSTSGTDITSTADFVLGALNGRFIVTGSAVPLLSLTGGNSQIATAGSIVHVVGTATAVDGVSGLRVGTEEPIQHGGGFV